MSSALAADHMHIMPVFLGIGLLHAGWAGRFFGQDYVGAEGGGGDGFPRGGCFDVFVRRLRLEREMVRMGLWLARRIGHGVVLGEVIGSTLSVGKAPGMPQSLVGGALI